MTPDEQEIAAKRVRTAWMRLIGLDDAEIQLHDHEYPAVLLSAELDQLDAAVDTCGEVSRRVQSYLGGLPEQPAQDPPSGPSRDTPTDPPEDRLGTTTHGL